MEGSVTTSFDNVSARKEVRAEQNVAELAYL